MKTQELIDFLLTCDREKQVEIFSLSGNYEEIERIEEGSDVVTIGSC